MTMAFGGNADRGFTWSDEETMTLLKFWGAPDAQNDVAGNKRNFVVYEKIADKMASLGYNRSTSQCREKIKRMKREYTLTKQYNGTTNGPKKMMRFYEQFECVLLEKQNQNQRSTTIKTSELAPSTFCPPIFCSKSNQWTKSEKRTAASANLSDLYSHTKTSSFDKADDANPWAPDVVLIEGEGPASSSQHESQSAVSASSVVPTPKKKRKIASRMAMFQGMMDEITTRFIESQELADSKFLMQLEAVEQERLESEQNMQKMWLEFEEKRQKEEQNHELAVMNIFKDMISQISDNRMSNKT